MYLYISLKNKNTIKPCSTCNKVAIRSALPTLC